jgi:histidinol phosphatase-like PHP family hydrolase
MARGLDAMVITEHHARWTADEVALLRTFCPGVAIYAGTEVTLREGYDLVVISGEPSLAFPPHQPLAKIMGVLEASRRERFVFVAHPFRYSSRLTPELKTILRQVDGIEMNSLNILRSGPSRNGAYRPATWRLYEEAREAYGLVPMFNSDAHAEEAVGAVANVIDLAAPPASEGELARALKAARPREAQDAAALGRLLGI